MSCSVISLPVMLFSIITTVVAESVALSTAQSDYKNSAQSREEILDSYNNYKNNQECDDVEIISEANIINKTFETPFMDKKVLLKTIEEHGFSNIQEEFERITCTMGTYALEFEKKSESEPYTVVISCREEDNAEEKVNDISSEYGLNVQEEAYLSIVEKLTDNNMQLESEEVLEDNTIVLTVNL